MSITSILAADTWEQITCEAVELCFEFSDTGHSSVYLGPPQEEGAMKGTLEHRSLGAFRNSDEMGRREPDYEQRI